MAAGAVAENRKYDHDYNREENDNNQNLDRSEQEPAQRDYRAQHGYYQQDECGDAAERLEN